MSINLPRAAGVVLVATLAVGVTSAAVHGQTVAGTPADEQAIRDNVALHASQSRQGDLDGMVSGLHPDADSRGPDGRLLTGPAEIGQRYREVTAGNPLRLAHLHPADSIRIRFLTPDVAFVDVDSVPASGAGARTPIYLVFTKVQGRWGVAIERRGVQLK